MGSTLLERPPRRAPTPPQRPRQPAPAAPRSRSRLRWVFPAALVVSVLVHLFLMVGIRFELTPVAPYPYQPQTEAVPRPIGIRVYDIVEVRGPAEGIPPEEERPTIQPPRGVVPILPQGAPIRLPDAARIETDQPVRGSRVSVMDRIAPRLTEPRLWGAAAGDPPPLPPEEVVRERIADRLGAWNDSVRVAGEAAARATDWTAKDGSGGRWGVSPEGIHLGKITVPIPVQFSPPPGRRDAVTGAIRNWNEINAQRSQAEVQESIAERVKAIRERREAERRDSTRIITER